MTSNLCNYEVTTPSPPITRIMNKSLSNSVPPLLGFCRTFISFGNQNFLRSSQASVTLEVEEIPHNLRNLINIEPKVIPAFLKGMFGN